MNAKDIMTAPVVALSPDHSVRHAVQMMLDHRVSGLPVVNDEGRLVGIITEGDLLRRVELGSGEYAWSTRGRVGTRHQAEDYIRSHSWKVGDLMTANVIAVDEDTPVGNIARLMEARHVKRLPVTRNGTLIGIVSRADLLRIIAVARLEAPIVGDEAIRRSVLARLGDVSDLDGCGLDVTVSDGIVHLCGEVDSEAARRAAKVAAEGVRGGVGVVDHLTVVPYERPGGKPQEKR